MPARQLIIGLDGADPGLLARWSTDGSLPEIRALQARGHTGALSTPPGLGDEVVWGCFHRGAPVGSHGRYYWKQLTLDGSRVAFTGGRLPASPPFWSRMAPDKRAAIIDLPKTPLWRETNGMQLCDWLVHGRDHSQPVSHPADVAGRVIGEFGAAPSSLCDYFVPNLDDSEIATVTERLCRSVAMKCRATRRFLAESDWELMITVFKEAHCATHMLWHLLDPTHPEYQPDADARLNEPVKAVYQALDGAIGEIVEQAGPETSILLFTPLTMARNVTGNHLMAPLAKAINRRHREGLGFFSRAMARLGKSGYSLCRALPHNEMSGALRLLVIDRDPGGIVAPGAPYQALCRQLADELADLRDAETGHKIVADVVISREAFPGPAVDDLPDLFIVWERSQAIGNAVSPHLGSIAAAPPAARRRPGNHEPGGHYIVAGPARDRWQVTDVDISNLAQSFLEAAGVTMAA